MQCLLEISFSQLAIIGYVSFTDSYIRMFDEQFFGYLSDGWKENEKDPKNYRADFERALLRRFEKYHNNFFAWLKDFSLRQQTISPNAACAV